MHLASVTRRTVLGLLAGAVLRRSACCRILGAIGAIHAARAAHGDVLQHPLRHGEGWREPLDRAARDALRRHPRAGCRSRRPAGGARFSDRRDHSRPFRSTPSSVSGATMRRGRGSFRRFSSGRIGCGWRRRVSSGFPTRPRSRGRSPGGTTHPHLDVGAVRRPRRPRVLPLQPAPRPRVATVARAQHGAAEAADRRAVWCQGAGGRHRGLQCRRAQPGARGARRHRTWRRRGSVCGYVPRPPPRRHDRRHVHGFKFGATGGEKIDYVLVPPGTDVLGADIVRTSRNERTRPTTFRSSPRSACRNKSLTERSYRVTELSRAG